MKKTIKVKNLISLIAVLILLFSIATIPAHATWNPTSKNRFGAWLGSALLALNITMQSTVAPIEQMYEYLADPVAQQVEYTYPETGWEDDIMNRAVVKIAPDVVTIDGVDYTDIWLSNSAAEKFRVNAFDFKTAYSLTSNTNGTFASGAGHLNDVPFYNVNGIVRSQDLEIPSKSVGTQYTNGLYNSRITGASGVDINIEDRYLNGNYLGEYWETAATYSPHDVIVGQYLRHYPRPTASNYIWAGALSNFGSYDNTPFDFDYVSRTIPADQVLDPDVGMNIRVPSDTPGLQVFIENNIDYTNDNGKYIDFNLDPDVKVELDDLIDIIAPILADLDFGDITFNTIPDTPQPEPGLPDTVFPDTQVDTALQPIINTINNNTQNIIENIPAPSEITNPIIQEIQDSSGDIIENIPKIDEICNNIDTAPYHDLDTGLDHLPTVFLPFITDLRSALGIWHYVTEWIGQISTTFAFVTGCLVGTSIMTPIYAAIAGFMCIKVYRRMTG